MAGGGREKPLFRVDGLGGHIDVYQNRIEVQRHGVLHYILEILHIYEGSTETTIPIRWITGVSIVEPLFLPGYIRFFYAGAPNYSKNYWNDAMAPNTLLMGYIDNRGFHRLKKFLDGAPAPMPV